MPSLVRRAPHPFVGVLAYEEALDLDRFDIDLFDSWAVAEWEIPERENFVNTLDDVVSGVLSFPVDSERYSFEIAADGTEVFFDPQGCASGLRWQLIAPDGVGEASKNCFVDFSWTLDAGTWTIRVYSNDDRFGAYQFRIWEIPDRENIAYTVGDVANGVLSFPTDSERYSFEVVVDVT